MCRVIQRCRADSVDVNVGSWRELMHAFTLRCQFYVPQLSAKSITLVKARNKLLYIPLSRGLNRVGES